MASVDLRNASRRRRTGHSNRGVAMEYPWQIPFSPVWDACGLSLVDELPNSRFRGSARDRRPGCVNPAWHCAQATASPSISLSFLRNTGHRNRIESRLREQPLPGTRGSALYLIRYRRVRTAKNEKLALRDGWAGCLMRRNFCRRGNCESGFVQFPLRCGRVPAGLRVHSRSSPGTLGECGGFGLDREAWAAVEPSLLSPIRAATQIHE